MDDMLTAGVRAAYLYSGNAPYRSHKYPLDEWLCGELFSALEAHRVPTFLHIKDALIGGSHTFEQFRMLHDACKAHPNLPVVLVGPKNAEGRILFGLMRQCSNLHIETSAYGMLRGLEQVAVTFGPDRLLFGTNLPFQPPAKGLFMVGYCNVPLEHKKMIAGDNLRRMMEEVR